MVDKVENEKFKKFNFNIDKMPGEYRTRVFIGGDYDQLPLLRKIGDWVGDIGFQPIITWHSNIPESEIHDSNLRLLHDCKYAVFEITHPAGHLMEMERCRDYNTLAIAVYAVREEGKIPDHVSRMILTGGFRVKGYPAYEDLKDIVEEFLQEQDGLFDTYLEVFGYKLGAKEMLTKINKDGRCKKIIKYCDLEVVDKGLSLTQLVGPHFFKAWRGKITNCKFSVDKGEKDLQWKEERVSDRYIEGLITFPKDDPLKMGDKPVSYSLEVDYENIVCLTREEFNRVYPGDEFPYEFTETTIKSPIEKLILEVNFFEGYKVDPEVTAFFGTQRERAVRLPSDSFNKDKARLIVNRPRIFYKYRIFWGPIEKEEFDKL